MTDGAVRWSAWLGDGSSAEPLWWLKVRVPSLPTGFVMAEINRLINKLQEKGYLGRELNFVVSESPSDESTSDTSISVVPPESDTMASGERAII